MDIQSWTDKFFEWMHRTDAYLVTIWPFSILQSYHRCDVVWYKNPAMQILLGIYGFIVLCCLLILAYYYELIPYFKPDWESIAKKRQIKEEKKKKKLIKKVN